MNMVNIYNINLNIVEREFRGFHMNIGSYSECFGLAANGFKLSEDDCAIVLNQGKDYAERGGWRGGTCWIKKLDKIELQNIPARRFANSVSAYFRVTGLGSLDSFSRPLALIYRGSPLNTLTHVEEGYFVSKFINGPRLYNIFSKLTYPKKETILRSMGVLLKACSEKGVYPLDFAPRDIVLRDYNPERKLGVPVIVDTEHIEFGEGHSKELIEKQREQFRFDYKHFVPNRYQNMPHLHS